MAEIIDPKALAYALLGGIAPALLWLRFWLKEDALKPEPRGLIIISFIAGMASVAIVFPLEKIAYYLLPEGLVLVTAWAAIEEMIKLGAIYFVALKSKYCDEPVDMIIYMITVALGFAAIENSMFLLGPLLDGEVMTTILTGNLRYIGATLLHVAASSAIGIAIGLSFYKNKFLKTVSATIGIATAIVLHTLFNFFIINSNGEDTFLVFFILWLTIILVIFFFERVKKITRT